MNIVFHPTYEVDHFLKEVKLYQDLWNSENKHIISSIERISGLRFLYKAPIHCIISTGNMSTAYPLILMDYPTLDEKRTNLIHELLHRLLGTNNVVPNAGVKRAEYLSSKGHIERATEQHKYLDLIFYDILIDLYSETVAKECVRKEKLRGSIYKDAWEWALSFTKEERAHKFMEIISRSESPSQGGDF